MLAIIVGNLDILIRRLAPDETRLRTAAEYALAGANRAASLTQRLLAFSRQQALDPKPTDINKCVGDMSEMLRRTLGETSGSRPSWPAACGAPMSTAAAGKRPAQPRGQRPRRHVGRRPPDAGDRQRLARPGLCRREPRGRPRPICAGRHHRHRRRHDPGGPPPRPSTPSSPPRASARARGWGLSQVHGFVKQSKGHIKIYSEIGVGTTVKLYLPRDASGLPAPEPAPRLVAAPIAERFTVLLVEDDPGVRQVAFGALREPGLQGGRGRQRGGGARATGGAPADHRAAHRRWSCR